MFAIDDILEFRRENRATSRQIAEDQKRAAIRAANAASAQALLDAEREYWLNYMLRATCHGDIEYGQDKLDELDRMERCALSAPQRTRP